jgi:hypothetical protein
MPTATLTPQTTTEPATTKKLPHATYAIRGQKRALITLGSGENCRLMDVPAALLDIAASGRTTPDSYLVEEGLRPRLHADEIQALVDDYLAMADRHNEIPMRRSFASETTTADYSAYAA